MSLFSKEKSMTKLPVQNSKPAQDPAVTLPAMPQLAQPAPRPAKAGPRKPAAVKGRGGKLGQPDHEAVSEPSHVQAAALVSQHDAAGVGVGNLRGSALAAAAADERGGGVSAGAGKAERGGDHGGGSILPYVLGGVALAGGGVALAGGGGSGASTPAKVPESVTTPTLALALDSGASDRDGITNGGTVAVSGLQTGSKWEYSTNSGTTWATGTGSSFVLAEGEYASGTVLVRQTSAGGTVSDVGKLAGAVTIDTKIVNPAFEPTTGERVLTFADATSDNGVTFTGKGEPGATITLKWMVQDTVLVPTGTAVVDASGNWSYTFRGTAIPDASIRQTTQVRISATDVAGNASPTIVQTVVTDPGLTLTGTVTAGQVIGGNDLTVNLYTAAGVLVAGGLSVAADGTYRADHLAVPAGTVLIATLANGTAADYQDEASGAARNLSAALLGVAVAGSGTQVLNINPLTTLAGRIAGLSVSDAGVPAGAITAGKVTAASTAVAQALGLGASDLASVVPQVVTTDGIDASATLTAAQKAGVLLAAISGLDAINNGNPEDSLSALLAALVVDGAAGRLTDEGLAALAQGAAVASNRLGTGLISGVAGLFASTSSGDARLTIAPITGDDVINLAERNSATGVTLRGDVADTVVDVTLRIGTRTMQAAISGESWSYKLAPADLTALANNGGVVMATASLAGGGTLTVVRPAVFAVTPPAAPGIDAISTDNAVNVAERDGGVAVSGTAAAGSTVEVTWGNINHSVVSGSDNRWTALFTASEIGTTEGSLEVKAVATDRFGNVSPAGARPITLDFTAPGKPQIDPIGDTDVIGAAKIAKGVVVTGHAEAGATVMIGWAGGKAYAVTAGPDESWSYTLDSSELPGDGVHQLTAYQIDEAGNPGQAVQHDVLVVQTITGIAILPVAGGDGVNLADAAQDITLAGIAPPGSELLVSWSGAEVKPVKADADGYWRVTYAVSELPVDGDTTLTVSGTDAAGAALETRSVAVVIDTQAPAQPSISDIAVDNVINLAEKTAGVAVSGTGEAGSTVTVTWGNTEHSQTVGQDRAWSVTFVADEVPADADSSTLTARLTDALGNAGQPVSAAVEIRTAIPATPGVQLAQDTGFDQNDGRTNNGKVQISGLLSDARWFYVTDGGSDWIEGSGTEITLLDGSYRANAVRVKQVDSAGNESAVGTIATPVVVVSQAPTISVDLDRSTGGDRYVNAAERAVGLTIWGTVAELQAGMTARITLRWGAEGETADVEVSRNGTWSYKFDPDKLPTDGVQTLNVTAVDSAGNVAESQSVDIEFVTTMPGQLSLALAEDTGRSGNDGVTKNPGVAIGGLTSGNQWQYSLDGGKRWRDGDYTEALSLNDGNYAAGQIQVRQIDFAGNIGQPGLLDRAITIDSSTSEPTIAALANNNVINAAAKQNSVTFSGKAEANASIALRWNNQDYQATADDLGNWQLILPAADIPADGDWTLEAIATDVAGNSSDAAGVSRTFTVDTADAAKPTIATIAVNDVISKAEKASGVTISGTTAPGSSVEVNFGGTSKAASVDPQGNWSVTYLADEIPADGTNVAVTARATNAVGNVSQLQSRPVEIDTATPAPTISTLFAADLVNAAQKAAGIEVSGTAEAGALVRLRLGSATVAATADTNGAWAAKFAAWQVPADGAATITAIATDRNGNVSQVTERKIGIDTAGPALPTFNAIAGDFIVTAAEAATPVAVSGTAEARSKVTVRWGSADAKTVDVSDTGKWSTTFDVAPGTATADVSVTAFATDPAGNRGPAISRNVAVIGSAANGPIIAPIAGDGRINAAERTAGVRITGLAAANAAVTVNWSGKATETVYANASGVWSKSYVANDLPADGTVTFTANSGGNAETRSLVIDTVAPDSATFTAIGAANGTPVAGDSTLTAAEKATGSVRISGTAERNATVQLTWAGLVKTATADGTGHWSVDYVPGEIPADGTTTLSLKVTDVAGNVGSLADQAITVATAIAGTDGVDALTGAGSGDVISAGNGNDRITLVDLAFRAVDGGAGADTLVFGSGMQGQTLDLRSLASGQLSGIETIDLSGGGGNGLVVDAASILADTSAGKLVVTGTAGERVTSAGLTQSGTVTEAGHSYTVFTGGSATLWVDTALQHVVL